MTAQYDSLFIYAPSFVLAEELEKAGQLFEGKALGTARVADLSLVQDKLVIKDADPAAFANERKKGLTVGKRKLKKAKQRTHEALLRQIAAFQAGKADEKAFRKESTRTMKRAWRDVFLAGLRAGGTKGTGAGKGKVMVKLSAGDDVWLKSAVQHEMRFLNKFLAAVVDETGTMSYEQRAKMYVGTLESFYNSARVIGLPNNVLIYWTGPHDQKTCLGCEYMFDNNPYTVYSLSTSPRSGLTPCLSNCRDRLLVRRVSPEQVEAQGTDADFHRLRNRYIRNLRSIKRQGFF